MLVFCFDEKTFFFETEESYGGVRKPVLKLKPKYCKYMNHRACISQIS